VPWTKHNSKEAWSSEIHEKDTTPNHELVRASEFIRAEEDSEFINEEKVNNNETIVRRGVIEKKHMKVNTEHVRTFESNVYNHTVKTSKPLPISEIYAYRDIV